MFAVEDEYNTIGPGTKACEPDWEKMIEVEKVTQKKCKDLAEALISFDVYLDITLELREKMAALYGALMSKARGCEKQIEKFKQEISKQAKGKKS